MTDSSYKILEFVNANLTNEEIKMMLDIPMNTESRILIAIALLRRSIEIRSTFNPQFVFGAIEHLLRIVMHEYDQCINKVTFEANSDQPNCSFIDEEEE